ncbi:MAG TPA: ABC transporter ATP-binding protein [bacterium]|jgi:branched-chain amino acid transport system ATP-binding protein|nr:ABC transporter ATP-binding protein [Dictyoglomota bacterium]HHV82023.1 ABC transporter ATP-binding protein [bacterium]HOK29368.1 ABC transporter ATP-binding protein [bacterium]HOL54770.1 ABC transporter ATP-binding protein [bacterium]HON72135.1 ABC transporter ATP-binding protein [bacterium]
MLKIEGIDVYYGVIRALKEVSLTVNDGEIVTLIGANGAGKTTTLRTISGLIRPKKGTITFDGQDLTRMAPNEIAGLGILQVPEGRRVFSNLTVMENLLMGAYLRRDDISRELDWVFSLFPRLKERQKQKAGTLSGGEQQMLAISRALMGKPRVILLDEPSLGLAPLLVLNIFETIKEINGQGVTILLVEQNAYMALQIAHRAYVIETGRVVMEGTGKELLNNDAVKKAYLGG